MTSWWPSWAEVAVPDSPYSLCGRKATSEEDRLLRVQELCESHGCRPGLSVPNSSYGLCGRKATFEEEYSELRSCVKAEVAVLAPRP